MKKILIAMFALLVLAVIPSALAMTVTVKDVVASFEGIVFGPVSVEAGETIPIKVAFVASDNSNDVVVKAELAYNGKHVDVESKAIDIMNGTTYVKNLDLVIPKNIDITSPGEAYTLSVELKDGKGKSLDWVEFDVVVQRTNDLVDIQKVITNYAQAGEPTLVTVVVKNIGADDQEDIYAKVSIPELNLVAEERMGDLSAIDEGEDEDVATVDIPLRIPEDAEEGTYTMKIEVSNDDDIEVSTTKSISISGVAPMGKSIEIVPTVTSQDVEQGQTATYSLRVANLGDSTKTYSIYVEGTDGWATYQINPLVLTLSPESSQLITLNIKVNDKALSGEHVFAVKAKSGETEKSISLNANVKGSTGGFDALLVSVIVLAVVLVILIVALVKTRKASEEASEAEESYY